MFNGNSAQAAQPAQPAQTPPASQVPAGQTAPATEATKEAPAPLTTQADWFKPADTDAKPIEFDPSKLFTADPEKLQEAIGNLNFLQGAVTPDVMSKIEAGGPEATQTMLGLLNRTAQQTMQASMQAAAKMVESAVAKAMPVVDGKVSQHLKSQQVESAIRESSPVFQSPAGEFMLNAVRDAMLAKFPNATTAEIKDNAKQLILDMITVGGPQKTVQDPTKDIMGTDWGHFLKKN
jgi:hypothetical protein